MYRCDALGIPYYKLQRTEVYAENTGKSNFSLESESLITVLG